MTDLTGMNSEKKPPAIEAPDTLPDHLRGAWDDLRNQVSAKTPPAALEAMARQLHLLRDAEHRIEEEGAVVADAKGNAGEHPAIKIQRDASKELRAWLKKYGQRY